MQTTTTKDPLLNLIDAIKSESTVKNVWVDKISRNREITLKVAPHRPNAEHTTVKLRAIIHKHLPKGATLNLICAPTPVHGFDFLSNKITQRGVSHSTWTVQIHLAAPQKLH